jgi:hypothetical protein
MHGASVGKVNHEGLAIHCGVWELRPIERDYHGALDLMGFTTWSGHRPRENFGDGPRERPGILILIVEVGDDNVVEGDVGREFV